MTYHAWGAAAQIELDDLRVEISQLTGEISRLQRKLDATDELMAAVKAFLDYDEAGASERHVRWDEYYEAMKKAYQKAESNVNQGHRPAE